jgi:hypothetical protein
MVVRPKRTDPISTRPIYVARVASKDLPRPAPPSSVAIRLFLDAGVSIDVEALVSELRTEKLPLAIGGGLLGVLAGRPQTEVRQAVSSLANALAWARIRDPLKQDYRMLPLRGEVDAEEALYKAAAQPRYQGASHPAPSAGPLYDGYAVQTAFAELLDGAQNLIVTGRHLALWDEQSKKWMVVGTVRGRPALVSTAQASDDASFLAVLRHALSLDA